MQGQKQLVNQSLDTAESVAPERGWRFRRTNPSLPEVYRSVHVPKTGRGWLGFLRKLLAFSGPGYLVAVGYMDPGNWATDLAGGSQFYYTLLSVVIISSLMAIFLQHLALKLGVVSRRDLAQACRDHFHPAFNFILWVGCEIAIAACDLAEVIGSAIALNLLFGLPLVWGVCLTACDVLAVLYLQNKGFRLIEVLVLTLIGVIAVSFGIQLVLSKPDFGAMALGCLPSPQILHNRDMIYVAIGILGATVMPHNLYLHSAIAQTRHYPLTVQGKREAIFFGTIDSTVALLFALFINAAILIVARSRPPGLGPKFDAHGHTGWPSRDGGFSTYTPTSRLTSVDYPAAGHHSCGDRNRDHGTERYGSALDSKPGDPEYAVKLRGHSSGHVYE